MKYVRGDWPGDVWDFFHSQTSFQSLVSDRSDSNCLHWFTFLANCNLRKMRKVCVSYVHENAQDDVWVKKSKLCVRDA